ncbi:MAG: hypothetical protein LBG65_03325 [Puniceicoccales bacterium]|jgi:hypothetical protein|nr:hypothetical protein [Puniceicoccales bacterium]
MIAASPIPSGVSCPATPPVPATCDLDGSEKELFDGIIGSEKMMQFKFLYAENFKWIMKTILNVRRNIESSSE